jgi:hypothetical protein
MLEISQGSTHLPREYILDHVPELPTWLINTSFTWASCSFHNKKQAYGSGQQGGGTCLLLRSWPLLLLVLVDTHLGNWDMWT